MLGGSGIRGRGAALRERMLREEEKKQRKLKEEQERGLNSDPPSSSSGDESGTRPRRSQAEIDRMLGRFAARSSSLYSKLFFCNLSLILLRSDSEHLWQQPPVFDPVDNSEYIFLLYCLYLIFLLFEEEILTIVRDTTYYTKNGYTSLLPLFVSCNNFQMNHLGLGLKKAVLACL